MPFRGSRELYIEHTTDEISRFATRKVVLLDPDTGIEPEKPNFNHVRGVEIGIIWDSLTPGDLLVLYQHSWREKQWRSKAQSAFADACRQTADQVDIYSSDLASDVAFLVATKT